MCPLGIMLAEKHYFSPVIKCNKMLCLWERDLHQRVGGVEAFSAFHFVEV